MAVDLVEPLETVVEECKSRHAAKPATPVIGDASWPHLCAMLDGVRSRTTPAHHYDAARLVVLGFSWATGINMAFHVLLLVRARI